MGCHIGGIKLISSNKTKYSYLPRNIEYIWEEYISDCQSNGELVIEMNQKQLEYNGKVATFDFIIRGNYQEPGFPLYIILHNGGINQSAFNNGEYLKAKFRYLSSVKNGVIVGVRGVNDLSNMHYTNESIILLDRIIKNFISFHQVDPNKVYLIGIGMGGDGVYQILNLIPSKFAAAVIVSGHSYGKVLKNLINVPLLIQVGELDYFYDRNKDAVHTYKKIKDIYDDFNQKTNEMNLNKNSSQNGNSSNLNMNNYKNKEVSSDEGNVECYIHFSQGANIVDYNKNFKEIPIIENPINWLVQSGNTNTINKNVNSITFLNKFTRDPFPKNLLWDLFSTIKIPENNKNNGNDIMKDTQMMKETTLKNNTNTRDEFFHGSNMQQGLKKNKIKFNKYFYWLEIGSININDIGSMEAIVRMDSKNNSFYIDSQIKYLRILVNEKMMDLTKEIHIYYKNQMKKINVTHNFQTERRTLLERGDYNYIFSAAIIFECKDLEHFKIGQYDEIYEKIS